MLHLSDTWLNGNVNPQLLRGQRFAVKQVCSANSKEVQRMHILGHLVRFLVSALVLLFVSWLVPGFRIGGFWSAVFLAIVIAVASWIIEGIFGKRITPFGRGIVGFVVSALVIWGAQFIVTGVSTSMIGAVLAALVIGIIDLFIPVSTPFEHGISGKEKK
jgi:putative membrane protein